MGNYTYTILTRSLVKKYQVYSQIAIELLFGFSNTNQAYIRQIIQQKGIFYYRPFNKQGIMKISLFRYSHRYVRRVIWDMKFRNKRGYCYFFADIISDVLLDQLSELSLTHNFTDPLLCFVPSDNRTVRSRNGYYATKITAQYLCQNRLKDEVVFKPLLIEKHIHTQRQSHVSHKSDRLKNPIGAFRITEPKIIKDRNIILYDDVRTTGATIDECTKILKHHGAKRILQITIAH